MNIKAFKDYIRDNDIDMDRFERFRICAESIYVLYEKEWKLARDETKYFYGDVGEDIIEDELRNKWEGLFYKDVIDLYCKMFWKLDDYIIQKDTSYNDIVDVVYYDIGIDEVYPRIETLEDNVEFGFAVMLLINMIDENSELYTEYAAKILSVIKECELELCYDQLKEKNKKVFVAMCFAGELEKARRRIEAAIRNCGYQPMLIDAKEHNHQIVAEIYKEIEDSVFVIADLSEQRGGVYYEAGYAVAKGKPLILSCRKSEIEKVHFDLAQINTIFWEDEDDLEERLKSRIKATVGYAI